MLHGSTLELKWISAFRMSKPKLPRRVEVLGRGKNRYSRLPTLAATQKKAITTLCLCQVIV
jgi:hypothetical protein